MSTLFITTQGAYLRKQGGRFLVTQKEKTLLSMPEAMVSSVMLLGYVQVSTQAVTELLDQGIPLLYLSRSGMFRGILQPGYPKNVERRLAQYECSVEPGMALETARTIVAAKMEGSLATLRKWQRNGWGSLRDPIASIVACRRDLSSCDTLVGVRGKEAQAAKLHFAALATSLPAGFYWPGRNRQPPRDPVNALLSFTYMIVLGHLVAAIYAAGMDPFVGFLHQLDYGRPSFALDLLEPLRGPWCDHPVMLALQSETITPADFETTSRDGCRLSASALPRFVKYLQGHLRPEEETGIRRPIAALLSAMQQAVQEHRAPDWSGVLEREAA